MSSPGSGSSPSIQIFEIRVKSQSVLKSVELSIGSFKRESRCHWGATTHKFELPSPCQLWPSEPLYLRVRFSGLIGVMSKNKIHLDELLSNVDTYYPGRQEWSKSFDKFDVVLGVKLSQCAGNALTDAESSTSGGLQPTTNASFNVVERFRVLVIGNSGVGKSSLINECFGVTEASVSHLEPGISNINTAILANKNGRFVLHDSQGFEHGEGENLQKVVDFLKDRKDMPNVGDQVHAVWLCFQVPLSEGDRLFEAGVEKLFRMKSDGELGPVPLITVFTKYDKLVAQVKFGNSMEFMRRTNTLDSDARNALLVRETNERFEALCVRPFKAVVGPHTPHIAVSTKKGYDSSFKELTALTAKYVKEYLAVEVAEKVAVFSAAAQRVNPAMKIDAVIAAGKKREGLLEGLFFQRELAKENNRSMPSSLTH